MTDLSSSIDDDGESLTDESSDYSSDSRTTANSTSLGWYSESSSSWSVTAAPVPVDEPTADQGPSQTDATTYYNMSRHPFAPIYSVQWNWSDRAPHGRLPRSTPPRQPPPWPITPLLRLHGILAPPALMLPVPADLDELRSA